MTPQQFQKRIDRVLTRLGMRWCFFAQIMAGLEVQINESIPTLATNGQNLMCNLDFWEKELNDDTEVSGIAHEVCHVVLEHMWRRGDRHPRLWNVACDYKVNQYLEEEQFVLGKGWLRDRKYDKMSEEQIYNILLEENGEPPDNPEGGEEPCEDGNPGNPGGGKPYPKPDFDDIKSPEGSKQEQQDAREKVRGAIIKAFNTYKAQGQGGGLAEYLAEKVTKVSEPWYERLLNYMNKMRYTESNWKRVNRRELTRTGIVTADIGKVTVDHVVIAVDTSGSVGRATLDYFGGHINTILAEVQPRLVRIIYCDASVNKITDVEDQNPIRLEVIGGGGTDFRPVFTKVEDIGETPDVLIYLTDTFGTYPEEAPEYPVIWASIYSYEQCSKPPFGEFLFIDEGE